LKIGERRSRPADPDRIHVAVEGKRITLRQWADVVGENGHDLGRATKAVKTGSRRKSGS
jgi:hypothetical protein